LSTCNAEETKGDLHGGKENGDFIYSQSSVKEMEEAADKEVKEERNKL